jgi:hypothetical protein
MSRRWWSWKRSRPRIQYEFTNDGDDTLALTFAYSCGHSWTAVVRAVRVNRMYEPNPAPHAQYAEKVAVYADVYPMLSGLNRKL